MKKFLTWLTMVALFVVLVVGGTVGFLYSRTTAASLPAQGASFAGQTLTVNGYSWGVPVLGGVVWRTFQQSVTADVQDLGTIDQVTPAVVLAEGLDPDGSFLVLTAADGTQVYNGPVSGLSSVRLPANGDYQGLLTAGRVMGGKPAKPAGFYRYRFRFTLAAQPTLTLSDDTITRGEVCAIYISNILDAGAAPSIDCELGSVWLAPVEGGWLGFIPAAYNAEAGDHALTVTVGSFVLEDTVTVQHRDFAKVYTAGAETDEPAGASTEFREKIWPLYTTGAGEIRWNGAFAQPVEGDVSLDFGVFEYKNGSQQAVRSTGVEWAAAEGAQVVSPAAGTVAFAGKLLLTGNTVVIDHGCGVKSYLYRLGSLTVETGAAVERGAAVGTAGSEALKYELKIGNKSIDPWMAIRGQGGLFYNPA